MKSLFLSFVNEIISKANSMVTNEQFASKIKLIDTAKLYKVCILQLFITLSNIISGIGLIIFENRFGTSHRIF